MTLLNEVFNVVKFGLVGFKAMFHLPESTYGRDAGLDQLRAVAIIYVLAVHTFDMYFPGGGSGVGVFFALAGYLTAIRTLHPASFNVRHLVGFWFKRLVRLYPPFIVAMLLIYISIWVCFPDRLVLFLNSISGLVVFQRPLNWEPLGMGVGILWSLRAEVEYYILLPIVVFFFGARRGILCLSLTLIFLSLTNNFLSSPEPRGGGIWLWGGAMALGALVAHSKFYAWPKFFGRITPVSSRTLFVMLGVLLFLPQLNRHIWWFEVMLAALLTALLINNMKNMTPRVLPMMPLIGRLSYCLYLVHGIVIEYMRPLFGFTKLEKIIFFLPLTFVLALAIHLLVEIPSIKLGNKLLLFVSRKIM